MSQAATFALIFVVTFVGSILQTVSGFGYVMIAMAILPMFLPISQCVVLSQIGGVLMCLWVIWGKFSRINWRYVFFPVLFASLGSLAGLLFLSDLSTGTYMKALGILLVVLAVWMWKLSARFKIKQGVSSGAVCGIVGGVMGALFGISVPPLVLYYSSGIREKDSYIVPLQITLAIQTFVCLAARVALNMWPVGVLPLVPAAVLGLVLGKFPGTWIYGKLDVAKLKIIIYIMVALLGVYTFISN